jgi:hypothetical protein
MVVVRGYVSIAHCNNCCYREIQRGYVQRLIVIVLIPLHKDPILGDIIVTDPNEYPYAC